MNVLVDNVMQELAMDGDEGSPLPSALETAIKVYYAAQKKLVHSTLQSQRNNSEGSDDEESSGIVHHQKVDFAFCSFVWKLLRQRPEVGVGIWEEVKTTKKGKGRASASRKSGPKTSLRGIESIPGDDQLRRIQGDDWRSLSLSELIEQHRPQQVRLVCSSDFVRHVQAGGRDHEIRSDPTWLYLQLIARGKKNGVKSSDLIHRLGIAGTASFYMLKNLIELNLVTKFTAKETQSCSTHVVHNRFRDECPLYQSRIRARRPIEVASQERPDGDDQAQLLQPHDVQEQADSAAQYTTETKSLTIEQVFVRLGAERQPHRVEQLLSPQAARRPGNRLVDIVETIGGKIESPQDGAGNETTALSHTEWQVEKEHHHADHPADMDEDGMDHDEDDSDKEEGDDDLEATGRQADTPDQSQTNGTEVVLKPLIVNRRKYYRVWYYAYSPLPDNIYDQVGKHRQEDLIFRALTLLSLTPEGLAKCDLHVRMGLGQEHNKSTSKKRTRDLYRLWTAYGFVESVAYSFPRRPKQRMSRVQQLENDSDGLSLTGPTPRMSAKIYCNCWRITDKGKEFLKMLQEKFRPLQAELQQQLERCTSSLCHEVTFDRLRMDLISAAGTDGLLKSTLCDALSSNRTFGRIFDRINTDAIGPGLLVDKAIVTLMDRNSDNHETTVRFFTLQTILQRSALEGSKLPTRVLKKEDVDSEDGRRAGVGVGGWLTLPKEQFWNESIEQAWAVLSVQDLDSTGRFERTQKKRRAREKKAALEGSATNGGPEHGSANSYIPLGRPRKNPVPSWLANADPQPEETQEPQSQAVEDMATHPDPFSQQDTAATGTEPVPDGPHVSPSTSQEIRQLPEQLAVSPQRVSEVSDEIVSQPPTQDHDFFSGPTSDVGPDPATSRTHAELQPTKRIRLEALTETTTEAPSSPVGKQTPEASAEQMQSPSHPQDVDKGSFRLTLWELRREAAIIDFLKQEGTGYVREDHFRTLFDRYLIANQIANLKELRPLLNNREGRLDLIRRSDNLDLLCTSVDDPKTQRPRKIRIVYLQSLTANELRAGIQEIQNSCNSRHKEPAGVYAGSLAAVHQSVVVAEEAAVAKHRLSRIRPSTRKRGRAAASRAGKSSRKRRSQSDADPSKAAEMNAKREIRRQTKETRDARKQTWETTWNRLIADHEFTEHQLRWLESSVSTAWYKFVNSTPTARHMNIEQLIKKRIQHVLSVDETTLIIPTKQRRTKHGGETLSVEKVQLPKTKKGGGKRTSQQRDGPNPIGNNLDFYSRLYASEVGPATPETGAGGKRLRRRTKRQFEADELTRDVGVILTCRDKERDGGRSFWSALRQLRINSVMLFKARWQHLKSFPAEDAYLRQLEAAWMAIWRRDRGTEQLEDHDPGHPTDFDLRAHLEYFRKHIDKNRVTSMTLQQAESPMISEHPLNEWLDEPQDTTPLLQDLFVSEYQCVQSSRLKTFLSHTFTISGDTQLNRQTDARQAGLAHTLIKIMIYSREEAHAALVVPFLSHAVGSEPITAALQELLKRSVIRRAHSEGRLLPFLNFDFTQDFHGTLNGLEPPITDSSFVLRSQQIEHKLRGNSAWAISAGAEGEDVGPILHLLSTGAVDLQLDQDELKANEADLVITEMNARDIVDADVTVTAWATFQKAPSLDGIVELNWNELPPRWASWLDVDACALEQREDFLLRNMKVLRKAASSSLQAVKDAGPSGLALSELMHFIHGQSYDYETAMRALRMLLSGDYPALFLAGYDVTRVVSAQFVEFWAVPCPKVEEATMSSDTQGKITKHGHFVPRIWHNFFGAVIAERRKACFDALLAECKNRPGNNLAQLVALFDPAMSRLDIVELLMLMSQVGLVELRCGAQRHQDAFLSACNDGDLTIIPANKFWYTEKTN